MRASILVLFVAFLACATPSKAQNDNSTSSPATVAGQVKVSMTLTSSPDPSIAGKTAAFTATLTSKGGPPTGGTVTFTYGKTTLGTATITASGIATFSTTTLPVGADIVKAGYAGSTGYSPASAATTQTVTYQKVIAPDAYDTSILYYFTGNGNGTTDGWSPSGAMVMDSGGNFYGTTLNGGTGGVGTVFKVSSLGQETILHSFANSSESDGYEPNGGLVMAADSLYGTTQFGGIGGLDTPEGTVFKLAPNGTESLLHTFLYNTTDGAIPEQGLIMDNGNLYGTTADGGNATSCGTVFETSTDGVETVLYSFSGLDGCHPGLPYSALSNPGPGLVMDAKGNIFGTTFEGGKYNSGVVFKLAPNGTETVLYSFQGGSDGEIPNASLALDSHGNLYGTAIGGTSGGGIIFKVSPNGTESVLYTLSAGTGLSEAQPGLILDSHQNLYGTIAGDPTFNAFYQGYAFALTPTGVLILLHDFPSNSEDGLYPQGGLVLTSSGKIYGVTSSDYVYSSGTVFELSPSATATAVPTFSVVPGTYSSPQTITISDTTPGATIYYSTTGIANTISTLYTGPVKIKSTSYLSAIAVAPSGAVSAPIQALYTIGKP